MDRIKEDKVFYQVVDYVQQNVNAFRDAIKEHAKDSEEQHQDAEANQKTSQLASLSQSTANANAAAPAAAPTSAPTSMFDSRTTHPSSVSSAPGVSLVLSTLLMQYATQMLGPDTEKFARHAKRVTVGTEDVLLMVRRNDRVRDALEDKVKLHVPAEEPRRGKGKAVKGIKGKIFKKDSRKPKK